MGETSFVDAKTLEQEVIKLLERYKAIKAENVRLKQELSDLQNELVKSEGEVVRLKTDYGRLKIAKVYGWDEANKREANDKITKLVREIDKCLDELNKLEV